jgi:hypothetical protein
MKLCPKCGTQYPDDANFCPIDAARLPPMAVAKERGGATGAAATALSTGASRAAAESRTSDGRRLLGGRFALGNRLGGRQTGEVYEAVDQSSGQTCVLKLIDAEVFPSNLIMQRTERELGKLARLDASGIARILDYGRLDGRLWVACERIAGSRSLLDIVFDEGPMPAQQAAAVLVEVGKALSEAARVGVIHRDLAPKNVLLGTGGGVKLINFGVAVPATAKVQGVPEFVAPEIIEGKPVDQRANIYSLGALFYYLVAGRPPYMGDPEDVYEQHLSAEPEPPSTHLDGVPEAVDAVILRALARSSSRRFMTLRQLLNDVERIAAGEEPATTASTLSALMPARGKGKSKKLAQTMLGGFQVAQDGRARQGEPGAGALAGHAAGPLVGANGALQGRRGEGALADAAGDIQAGMAGSGEVSGTIGGQDSERSLARTLDAGTAGTPGAANDQGDGAYPDQASEPGAAGGQSRAGSRPATWSREGAAEAPARASDGASGSATRGTRAGEDGGRGDREKRSQTGAAEGRAGARAARSAGDDAASREMISEMNAGRGKLVAALVVVLVLVAVLIVYAVTSG